ncbi:transglutaminase domain-containing protein, partial [Arthrospira platensis SPKY1]|nr:transglutaminase domain-containing protein [Arthrospira platensis SPKY1]
MRDEIRFGFPSRFDDLKASEIIVEKIGIANTKTTLFKALLDAAGIPARIHYGIIDLRIYQGIVPGYMLWVLPKTANHSWIEAQVNGHWQSIDSYIFDRPYFR